MTLRLSAVLLALLALPPLTASAEAQSNRTHVVYDGQRLGSIAKRYGVSVDALCTANDMRPTDALRPGQRLLIPARGDRDGSRTRLASTTGSSREVTRRRSATEPASVRTHRVESGQRLESIARRYTVSVEALRKANHLNVKAIIRPGQLLRIPAPGATGDEPEVEQSSHSYMREPARRGVLELNGFSEHFRGRVFDKKGKVAPGAFDGVSRVLAATGSRPHLDPRLLRVLTDVSDTFGGRPLRIVSGYRTTSYYQDSRHKISKAVDFSIPGVPNQVVRDYLRTLRNVGVGYYPNSSFVHVDVREYSAYWVDYAGPGERPRKHQHQLNSGPDDVHEEEPGEVPDMDAPGTNANGAIPQGEPSGAAGAHFEATEQPHGPSSVP